MPCKGLHCPGCRGGGGVGLAVIVAVVLVIAAIAKAAGKAIGEAAHVLAVALEVAFIAAVTGVALLAAVVLTRLGIGLRRRYTNRAAAAVSPITYQAVPVDDEPLEIEPPRPRMTGDQFAGHQPARKEPSNPLT